MRLTTAGTVKCRPPLMAAPCGDQQARSEYFGAMRWQLVIFCSSAICYSISPSSFLRMVRVLFGVIHEQPLRLHDDGAQGLRSE